MTSEMQERIARAVYATYAKPGDDFDREPERFRNTLMVHALAVMKAMREPTEAMIRPGCHFSSTPATAWKTMLDAEITLAEGGSRDRD